jgi:hypothetical protein
MTGFGALCSSALVLVAGCASVSVGVDRDVGLVQTEAVLTDVEWATEVDALVGLTEDDRLLLIEPSTGVTLHALQLNSSGDNLALLTEPTERVFVPQPALDRVAVIATDSLKHLRNLDVGPEPSWVAASAPAHTLFALPEGGGMVTGVDVETHEVRVSQRVDVGREVEVEGAENSRTPTFWVASPDRVEHYGNGYPPTRTGGWRGQVNTDAFGPDRDEDGRAYLAEEGSSRVLAVDRSRGEISVVDSQDVGASVEFLESRAKEEFRVFVVTEDRLKVLRSDDLEILDELEFRSVLERAGLADAKLSGMVVGDHYVYLTLDVESRVVRIHKPSD